MVEIFYFSGIRQVRNTCYPRKKAKDRERERESKRVERRLRRQPQANFTVLSVVSPNVDQVADGSPCYEAGQKSILHHDNKSVILLEENSKPGSSKCSRWLKICCFFLSDHVEKWNLNVTCCCPTGDVTSVCMSGPLQGSCVFWEIWETEVEHSDSLRRKRWQGCKSPALKVLLWTGPPRCTNSCSRLGVSNSTS